MEPRAAHTQLSANRGGRAYKGLPSKMVETQEDFHPRFFGHWKVFEDLGIFAKQESYGFLPHFSTYYLPLEPPALTLTINQPIARTGKAQKDKR